MGYLFQNAAPNRKPDKSLPERRNQEIVDCVIYAVTQEFKIDKDVLSDVHRDAFTTEARRIAMYLMRELTTLSLTSIGKIFNRDDHSTVMHAVKKTEKKMGADSEYDAAIKAIMADVRGALEDLAA